MCGGEWNFSKECNKSDFIHYIMINYIFANIQPGIGRSLFADDGSLWTRGRNVNYVVKKEQEGINQEEALGRVEGFRFSGEKTKTLQEGRGMSNRHFMEIIWRKLKVFGSWGHTLTLDQSGGKI